MTHFQKLSIRSGGKLSDYKSSDKFCKKVTSWLKKIEKNKVLDNS